MEKKVLILGLVLLIGFSGFSIFAESSDDLLLTAIKERNVTEVKRAIEEGADVNAKGYDAMTPLMKTVGLTHGTGGSVEIAELLIEKGADIYARDGIGDTVLMWAAGGNSVEIAKLLIAKGVDVNATDKIGTTPLMWAAYKGFVEMVELLIDSGADINAENEYGTALQRAKKKGHEAVIELLKKHGAK